jgi:putative peptidoglycan lipid II flippase
MSVPSTTEAAAAPAGSRRQFERHLSAFTLATLSSRILGYLRDAGIAYLFGGGMYTDCYYAAFRIANFLRRTLGEGALSASFVPVLTQERLKGIRPAREFFSSLWTGLAIVTSTIVVLGIWQAHPIVLALTYGFASDPEKLGLTVTLTRLLFPHFFFVTAAALEQGALYVSRRFFLPAVAPAAFSISILGYLGLLWTGWLPLHDRRTQLLGLAMAATLGSALQWLAQMPAIRREGLSPTLRSPAAHPGVRQVLGLMGPSVISVATDQVDTLVDTVFASFLVAGSITAIYNASRLLQLPLALFGISTATVALTHLSEHASKGDLGAYRRTLGDSLRLTAFILFPATAGLIALAGPLVRLLFQHGAFTEEASRLTAGALTFYSLGLVAYGWTKVLVMAHYALKDAVTPVRVGMLKVLLNVVFCLALVSPLKVNGLTLAASMSSWICVSILLWRLHKRIGLEAALAAQIAKSVGASLLLYAGCVLFQHGLHGLRPGCPSWLEAGLTMALALPLYYGLAALFNIQERRLFWSLLGSPTPEEEEEGVSVP